MFRLVTTASVFPYASARSYQRLTLFELDRTNSTVTCRRRAEKVNVAGLVAACIVCATVRSPPLQLAYALLSFSWCRASNTRCAARPPNKMSTLHQLRWYTDVTVASTLPLRQHYRCTNIAVAPSLPLRQHYRCTNIAVEPTLPLHQLHRCTNVTVAQDEDRGGRVCGSTGTSG